jgi:hypothetical protein
MSLFPVFSFGETGIERRETKPMTNITQDDAVLAAKITAAIKEVDAATVTRNEKALAAGRLLVEAHKRHPTEKAFKEFLLLAGGVQIRRAQDLIALALGRKDFEQRQIENAAAQQRHRDKLKAEKIEREKEKAALPKPDPKPDPKPEPAKPEPGDGDALRNARWRERSAASLREFEAACRSYLPHLTEPDLSKAKAYFSKGKWKRKTNREAA